ncbi:MAG: hypothetical protein R3C60_01015 [Parvularculaceae bacterium]
MRGALREGFDNFRTANECDELEAADHRNYKTKLGMRIIRTKALHTAWMADTSYQSRAGQDGECGQFRSNSDA